MVVSFLEEGVTKAVENINNEINNSLVGMNSENQELIDGKLIELDGTNNKSRLGANAILGVSMANVKASSASKNQHLFQSLGNKNSNILPVPMMNISMVVHMQIIL